MSPLDEAEREQFIKRPHPRTPEAIGSQGHADWKWQRELRDAWMDTEMYA